MSTSVGWYYVKDGAQHGPLSWEQLVMTTQAGTVGPQDLVWNASMQGWMPASSVPGLGPATPPTAYSPPSNTYADDPAMRMILPIGRSGWAIAAGYLGLVSVLLLPAPFALATGIYAISEIRRDRSEQSPEPVHVVLGLRHVEGSLMQLARREGFQIFAGDHRLPPYPSTIRKGGPPSPLRLFGTRNQNPKEESAEDSPHNDAEDSPAHSVLRRIPANLGYRVDARRQRERRRSSKTETRPR